MGKNLHCWVRVLFGSKTTKVRFSFLSSQKQGWGSVRVIQGFGFCSSSKIAGSSLVYVPENYTIHTRFSFISGFVQALQNNGLFQYCD